MGLVKAREVVAYRYLLVTGIITPYLISRLLVRSGFPDTYLISAQIDRRVTSEHPPIETCYTARQSGG
jgi:hypothetical protein